MLRGAIHPSPSEGATSALGAPFRQGLLSNVLNPKIALFFLAAIPQFAGNGAAAPLIGVLLIVINALINGLWLAVVATSVGRVGARMRNSSALRWVEGVVGVALVGLAGRVVVSRD